MENTSLYPPYPGTALRVGSSGNDVKTMQSYLNTIRNGLYPQMNLLVVDGQFGSNTQKAVRTFQSLRGLSVDGVIGRNTWNEIVNVYTTLSGRVTPIYPGYLLQQGSSGSAVVYMQQQLNIVSAFYTAINSLTTDGKFGGNTYNAVRRFQAQFGLSVDGVIGRNTWNKIVEVATTVAEGRYSAVSTRYPGTVLQYGSSGDSVRFIESYLNRINSANSYGWPVLTVDGMFGTNCRNNVMAFQRLNSLTVDGKVGSNTWAAIIRAFNNTL